MNVWEIERTQLIAASFIRWNVCEWWVQVFFNSVRVNYFFFLQLFCVVFISFHFFSHVFLPMFIFISFARWRFIPSDWFFSVLSSLPVTTKLSADLMEIDVKNTTTLQHQQSKTTSTMKLIDFSLNQWLWKHSKMNINYTQTLAHDTSHSERCSDNWHFFNLP